MCTAVQRGMGSIAYRPGPLSHLEKPLWHIQRYLARTDRRGARAAGERRRRGGACGALSPHNGAASVRPRARHLIVAAALVTAATVPATARSRRTTCSGR